MSASRYHSINGILLAVCIALTTSAVQAQNIYIPRNLKQAYQKGTRSMDGKPGKNYWQNFARYRINITAAPPNRTIQGTEEISYVNNSPDTLRFLVFKLFLNSHRPGAIRQQIAGPDYLTTGLHIDRYAENNTTRLWPDVSGTVHRMPRWIKDPSAEQDLPIIIPANVLSGAALGSNEYGKAALGYLAIKDLLGDAIFKNSLHEFMNRWHGKHPTPWDMFFSFNSASGKDLNWFWSNWFFSNNYIDLAIQNVAISANQCRATVQNIGGYVAPFDVVLTFADGTTETVHQTPAVWQTNQKQAVVKIPTKKKIQPVKLAGGIFMDADETNNSWLAK